MWCGKSFVYISFNTKQTLQYKSNFSHLCLYVSEKCPAELSAFIILWSCICTCRESLFISLLYDIQSMFWCCLHLLSHLPTSISVLSPFISFFNQASDHRPRRMRDNEIRYMFTHSDLQWAFPIFLCLTHISLYPSSVFLVFYVSGLPLRLCFLYFCCLAFTAAAAHAMLTNYQ